MNKLKKAFWTIYVLVFCKPYSLNQFKNYCTKVDGMTDADWIEYEKEIRTDVTLSNYFKLNKKYT